jgi:hypothetical protein
MAKKKPLDPLVTRLVEMVFASPDEVARWLARIGLEIVSQDGTTLTEHNPHLNLRADLLWHSDPISRVVSLGFALCGVYWPFVCPGLLEAVNERWKGRPERPIGPGTSRCRRRDCPHRQSLTFHPAGRPAL